MRIEDFDGFCTETMRDNLMNYILYGLSLAAKFKPTRTCRDSLSLLYCGRHCHCHCLCLERPRGFDSLSQSNIRCLFF